MRIIALLTLLLLAITISGAFADYYSGTGAELRSSTNYLIADTLGQFVVGESSARDSYSCGRIEHGFWHSDVDIPTIADLKGTPNYQWVDAYGKIVIAGSDQFDRVFYLSEQNRASAIRVNLGSNPLIVSEGDMVDVSGVIKGTDVDRYIDYPVVIPRFSDVTHLSPFFLSNRWLGGNGTDMMVDGGVGPLNTGLMVRTSGRVTYVDTASPCRFFYVDDGSGLSDGLVYDGDAMVGVRIWIMNLAAGNTIIPPSVGQQVVVTGICSAYSTPGKTCAQIRPRTQGDLQVISND
jgi:hypothetical protein